MARTVLTGLEVLKNKGFASLKGRKIGLVVNQASVSNKLEHAVDLFRTARGVKLVKVFGPQHGPFGHTQDNMIEWGGYRDKRTGLVFHSLYGKYRKPTKRMLSGIDTLVFDLQDVGARWYTFISTMSLCMEACGENGVKFVVLDRPNPIGGRKVEGNVVEQRFKSFVGIHPLAARHGMTVGELALMFLHRFGIKCELEIVRMKGWKRDMMFGDTGLTWVPPSPNMPLPETAMVYAGMCLLEGTNISEGRGTTRPFEQFGTPGVDPYSLCSYLESKVKGAVFRPVYFQPSFQKHAGRICGGAFVHVVDKDRYKPFKTAIAAIYWFKKNWKQFKWKRPPYEYEYKKLPMEILLGSKRIFNMLNRGFSPETIDEACRKEAAGFKSMRRKFLLYD